LTRCRRQNGSVRAPRVHPSRRKIAVRRGPRLARRGCTGGSLRIHPGEQGFLNLAKIGKRMRLRFSAGLRAPGLKPSNKENAFFPAGLKVQLPPTQSRGLPPGLPPVRCGGSSSTQDGENLGNRGQVTGDGSSRQLPSCLRLQQNLGVAARDAEKLQRCACGTTRALFPALNHFGADIQHMGKH